MSRFSIELSPQYLESMVQAAMAKPHPGLMVRFFLEGRPIPGVIHDADEATGLATICFDHVFRPAGGGATHISRAVMERVPYGGSALTRWDYWPRT